VRTELLQGQRIEPGQRELVFTVDPDDVLRRLGTVRMRLLDAAGAPLAGMRPSLCTRRAAVPARCRTSTASS
jgi:hypothetical protein